jgi:hypothetical protein
MTNIIDTSSAPCSACKSPSINPSLIVIENSHFVLQASDKKLRIPMPSELIKFRVGVKVGHRNLFVAYATFLFQNLVQIEFGITFFSESICQKLKPSDISDR